MPPRETEVHDVDLVVSMPHLTGRIDDVLAIRMPEGTPVDVGVVGGTAVGSAVGTVIIGGSTGVGLIVALACCVTDWRLRFAGPYRTNPFL